MLFLAAIKQLTGVINTYMYILIRKVSDDTLPKCHVLVSRGQYNHHQKTEQNLYLKQRRYNHSNNTLDQTTHLHQKTQAFVKFHKISDEIIQFLADRT